MRSATPFVALLALLALGWLLAFAEPIPNATYTGPPVCTDAYIPSLNAATPLHVCSMMRRPPGGGGMRVVVLFTADGILAETDMLAYGHEECFGADAWPSRFSGTMKLVVNCKTEGNDRIPVYVDSGLPALPVE